jgi:hypothetical protein
VCARERRYLMRLTYRDGIAAILAAAVIAVTFAVTQGWDWPLLGTTRSGIVALGILGVAGCAVGNRSDDMASAKELVRRPGMIAGSVLGVVGLVLFIAALVANTETLLVALAVDLVVLSALATTRHAFVPSRTPTGRRIAGAHA